MKKSDFDRLMERYLTNQVSEQEKVKIEAWLDMMKTEDTTTLELSKEDEERLFQKITSKVSSVDDVIALKPEREQRTGVAQWTFRIAASLALALGLTYTIWRIAVNKTDRVEIVSSTNETRKTILSDGSLVWLRGEGKFNFVGQSDQGTRYGELEGEALFEIAKDAEHPFIIKCGTVQVKVLGTSFSIKTSKDQFELSVLTGKVNLSSSDINSQAINVEPGEQVIFKSGGEMKKSALDGGAVTSLTANTEYDMKFANTSMAEVLKKIENKFNKKVKLANGKIGQCRITADFTDHSLDSTLQMMADILDIQYSQDENTISISGKGC